jgi:glutamyl-tRNA reductase
MALNYFIIGVDHRNTSREDRNSFGLVRDDYSEILISILDNKPIETAFILFTSGRLEFHIFSRSDANIESVENVLSMLMGDEAWTRFSRLAYRKSNFEAYKHICRVACGMESELIGDPQITSQFKTAVALAQEYSKNSVLDSILGTVIKCANRVKKDTAFGESTVSIAGELIRLIKSKSTNKDMNIALLGEDSEIRTISKKIQEQKLGTIQNLNSALKLSAEYSHLIIGADYTDNNFKALKDCDATFIDLRKASAIDTDKLNYYSRSQFEAIIENARQRKIDDSSRADSIIEEFLRKSLKNECIN